MTPRSGYTLSTSLHRGQDRSVFTSGHGALGVRWTNDYTYIMTVTYLHIGPHNSTKNKKFIPDTTVI